MSSTKDWIAANIRDGEKISKESYQCIADFCVMWALFEGTELHGIEVAVDELQKVAQRTKANIQDKGIEVALCFWKQRYVCDGEINEKFDNLNLIHQPHKVLVSQVLLETEIDREKIIHALLIITYRIRNNLFHGNKDITQIRHQNANLDTASNFLKNILLASGRYIYLNKTVNNH